MPHFTFHDNNSHHESLTDWIKRERMVDNDKIDRSIHVELIGKPAGVSE